MNFKWITATEIDAWTAREPRRAQEILPKLIIKLILASTKNIENFNFPSGKSIQYSGFDGFLTCFDDVNFVPKGNSVWEMGTNENIISKFDDDFTKRTKDPLEKARPENVFVFVSSRIWSHRVSIAEKVQASKDTTDWKDVIIIDANYLEQWLENCYAVALWFSNIIGKKLGNYISVEEYWKDMTMNVTPNFNSAFFSIGRQEAVDDILMWFTSDERHIVLSADSNLEALLLLISIFINNDNPEYARFLSKCLIVQDAESWDNLISIISDDTIVIPIFNIDSGMKYYEKSRAIFIVNKYSPLRRINKSTKTIEVPKQRKNDFENALKQLGIEGDQLFDITYKTKRNFSALYRRLTTVPTRKMPLWINEETVEDLIPALFIGSWDGQFSGDIELIEELSGSKYDEYIAKLSKWLHIEESPLLKVDSFYMMISIPDMWDILWDRITEQNYSKLFNSISSVFNVKDPTYELSDDKWFAASLYGKKHNYSEGLLEGLVISMIMLSERDNEDNNFNSSSTKQDVNHLVANILEKCQDWQSWYTIAKHLPLLVEASPSSVLSKIEKKVDSDDHEFWKLFAQPKDWFTSRTFYTHILWALEKLSWDKEYVVRTINVLAKLVEKKFDYKLVNTPLNTLYHIFCLWSPQTCLSFDERMKVIEHVLKNYPYAGWRLIDNVLPDNSQITSNISKPRWKEYDQNYQKRLTNKEYWDSVTIVINMALERLTPELDKWEIVISKIELIIHKYDEISSLLIEHRKQFNTYEQTLLSDKLGDVIYRHRKFKDADWSMAEDKILQIEELYKSVMPEGPTKFYHLFRYHPYDLNPLPYNADNYEYEKEQEKFYELRKIGLNEIYAKHGIEEIFKLLEQAENTEDLGKIIAEYILNFKLNWELIFKFHDANKRILKPILVSIYLNKEITYIGDSLSGLKSEDIGTILCALPMDEDVFDIVNICPDDVQKYYWENTSASYLYNEESPMFLFVIEKMFENKRPYTLIDTLAYSKFKNSDYIIKMLEKALELYPNSEHSGMEFRFIPSHDIAKLFEKLYDDSSIDEENVAKLELAYLPIFDQNFELKCITNQITYNPRLFIELLTLAYKNDNGDTQIGLDDEQKASNAYNILDRYRKIPGYKRKEKLIDKEVFNSWMDYVLETSRQLGYSEAGEMCIGKLLSFSLVGEDGVWPHEVIRMFLEAKGTDFITRNFITGKRNQRGVHTVTGGLEELEIAKKYEDYANRMMFEFPKVAAIIRRISEYYIHDAKYEKKLEMKDFY